MLYTTLLNAGVSSPGSPSDAVAIAPSAQSTTLRFSATQIGGPTSTVVLHALGDRGVDAITPVTLTGTVVTTISIPASSSTLYVFVACTGGAATIRVEQAVLDVRSVGDFSILGDVVPQGLSSGFQAITVAGATTTIDLSLGFNLSVALAQSTTFVLSNPSDGERYVFVVTQANNFTITWPAGAVIWSPALAPVSVGAGKIDAFTLLWKSALGKYLGSATQDFA